MSAEKNNGSGGAFIVEFAFVWRGRKKMKKERLTTRTAKGY